MAHPIVSQMPKAGNSRLDNFLNPFLPFFTAFTLINICKLVLYILGEGHKFTSS